MSQLLNRYHINQAIAIFTFLLKENFKASWFYAYTFFLFLVSLGIFLISGNAAQSIAGLLNVITLVTSLVSLTMSTVYFFNLRQFMVLVLTQPISRNQVYLSCYASLIIPLIGSLILGIISGALFWGAGLYEQLPLVLILLSSSILLTLGLSALGFLYASFIQDKTKGFAFALLTWLYLTFIHDGLILLLAIALNDYPVEYLVLGLVLINPVSCARVFVLLSLNIAALMGITAYVFKSILSLWLGQLIIVTVLLIWIIISLFLGSWCFRNKDL